MLQKAVEALLAVSTIVLASTLLPMYGVQCGGASPGPSYDRTEID